MAHAARPIVPVSQQVASDNVVSQRRLRRDRPRSFRLSIASLLPSLRGQHADPILPTNNSTSNAPHTYPQMLTPTDPNYNQLGHPLASPACSTTSTRTTTGLLSPEIRTRNSNNLTTLLGIQRKTEQRHRKAWKRRHRRQAGMGKPYLYSLLSGVLVVILLATYLGLVLTVAPLREGVNIALILILIFSSILFFHSLVRLCLFRSSLTRSTRRRRGPRTKLLRGNNQAHIPPYRGRFAHPEDYVPVTDVLYSPTTPVRVHLIQDDAALFGEIDKPIAIESVHPVLDIDDDNDDDDIEDPASPSRLTSTTPTAPPPAYGLWRCSVRADPNLLHWAPASPHGSSTTTIASMTPAASPRAAGGPHTRHSLPVQRHTHERPRPPSYSSDDGVEYVRRARYESAPIAFQSFNGAVVPEVVVSPASTNSGEDRVAENNAVREATRRLLEG